MAIGILSGLNTVSAGECCACSSNDYATVAKITFSVAVAIRLCSACREELCKKLNDTQQKESQGRAVLALLMAASKEDLMKIEGIGEDCATSVYAYFRNGENKKAIEQMLACGVNPTI